MESAGRRNTKPSLKCQEAGPNKKARSSNKLSDYTEPEEQMHLSTLAQPSTSGFTFGTTFPQKLSSDVNQFNFGRAFGQSAALIQAEYTYVHRIADIMTDSSLVGLRGRVVFKSALRIWEKDSGSGKVFDAVIIDASGEIQFSSFEEAFYENVKVVLLI